MLLSTAHFRERLLVFNKNFYFGFYLFIRGMTLISSMLVEIAKQKKNDLRCFFFEKHIMEEVKVESRPSNPYHHQARHNANAAKFNTSIFEFAIIAHSKIEIVLKIRVKFN